MQADLVPPRFNGGNGQNVSSVSTITSTSSSVVSNATSYGGSAIAINGSTSTEPSVKTSAATPDPMNLPLQSRAAKQETQNTQATSEANDGMALLIISETGAEVTIMQGDPDFPYPGGVISSTGVEQVIFLPKGQALAVSLSGTGSELAIARSIAQQVTVNNSGVGADVSVF
jgi:hypothetical protein